MLLRGEHSFYRLQVKDRLNESDLTNSSLLSAFRGQNLSCFRAVGYSDNIQSTKAVAAEVCCRFRFDGASRRNSISMGRGFVELSDCFGRYLRGTGPHSPSMGSGQSGPNLHID